ncbi:MAG TPA: NUDIX domain-containing protein [Sulfolobales archaeon]|nr:NUDIX domain-containing protein [Sulfolobales archaeon]
MDPHSSVSTVLEAVEVDSSGNCLYRDYDAAVAVIYEATSDTLILIERIEREGDPWSGHIAFPGGFRRAGEDSYETAVREAMEEIHADLRREIHLGSMGIWITRGSVRVVPHLFLAREPLKTAPGSEVKRILRIRIPELAEIPCPESSRSPPCLHAPSCGGKVIWGLTARILARLMRHERSER